MTTAALPRAELVDEVRRLVRAAAAAPDERWTEVLLARDPAWRRVPPDVRASIRASAVAHGLRLAGAVRADRGAGAGAPDLDAVARDLGARVETSDRNPVVTTTMLHSEYETGTARILLYARALEPLDAVLAELGADLPPARDVYLAHELYHHRAHGEGHGGWSVRGVHPWTRWQRRSLPAASEVAAHAFARAVTGSPAPQLVHDALAVLGHAPERCLDLLDRLAQKEH